MRLDGHWVQRAEPRDGLRPDRRRRRRRARVRTLPMADVRAGHAGRLRRLRHQGDRAGRRPRPRAPSGSWSPTSPARSRRPCWSARSPTACARPRRPARRCSGSAARASCTPAPRRRWSRWSRPGTSTCCSPATRWPPTTSSPRSTAPRSASTSPAGQGVEHGHEHHIRAINTIRKAGSIRAAVEQGVLTERDHARAGHPRQGVRAGRLGARRRPAAGRLHRRDRGPARDARQAGRRRASA